MKNKTKIIIVIVAFIAVLALGIILLNDVKEKNDGDKADDGKPVNIDAEDIVIDTATEGISVVSVDSIAGMFVEDGTDEVLSDILTVTFRNDTDRTLQYAKLILAVGEDEYVFEISTLPAGASVRAMEINRKPFVSSKGDVSLRQENVAWFLDEPSMYENMFSITQRNNAIIVENISGSTVNAPIYVYYKNYTDGVYIGGITYRASTQEQLEPGQTVVLNANHFDPEVSRLMFITYAP